MMKLRRGDLHWPAWPLPASYTRRQRPYRYAYCLGALRPTNLGNALVKHDIAQGTAQRWHEPGSMPGGVGP